MPRKQLLPKPIQATTVTAIKIAAITITLTLVLSLTALIAPLPTQAEDLPIDITAIGRQEARENQLTTRIGANLFTEDAQRTNEALARQIYLRHAATQYLFSSPPIIQETDLSTQIISAASNSGLFSQPATFITFTTPQEATPIPMWVIAPVIALCAIGGFIWALISAKRKRRQQANVH